MEELGPLRPPAPNQYTHMSIPIHPPTLQYKEVEELGLLVDRDDQGVLLQARARLLGGRRVGRAAPVAGGHLRQGARPPKPEAAAEAARGAPRPLEPRPAAVPRAPFWLRGRQSCELKCLPVPLARAQIFTKPLGDRPTVFFEIIERLCALPSPAEVGVGFGVKKRARAGRRRAGRWWRACWLGMGATGCRPQQRRTCAGSRSELRATCGLPLPRLGGRRW